RAHQPLPSFPTRRSSDLNSWAGTEFERMGAGYKTFAALSATLDGMPLVYSGQEEPLKKRLEFFEKDTIPFGEYAHEKFYTTLNRSEEHTSELQSRENLVC